MRDSAQPAELDTIVETVLTLELRTHLISPGQSRISSASKPFITHSRSIATECFTKNTSATLPFEGKLKKTSIPDTGHLLAIARDVAWAC